MKFKRVWHPVDLWEEVGAGMWSTVDNKRELLHKAIKFTSNHQLYGEYMMRVVATWKYSCENALTDSLINKRAWVGHAACALAIGCPEDIVRQAWGALSNEQRLLANKEAERAIQWWNVNRGLRFAIRENMAQPMLQEWDS